MSLYKSHGEWVEAESVLGYSSTPFEPANEIPRSLAPIIATQPLEPEPERQPPRKLGKAFDQLP
jgi:hypothetical protein